MQINKINFTIKILVLLTFTLMLSEAVKSQNAYVLSDIIIDLKSGRITSLSGTYLDYAARLQYDPAVCGTMFQERTKITNQCFTGYNSNFNAHEKSSYGAMVELGSTFPALPDIEYDVISHHYAVPFFHITMVDSNDSSCCKVRKYYDPLSLNQNGGQQLASYTYRGQADYSYAQLYEYQYFVLGSTGRTNVSQGASGAAWSLK
jgi:hypothetical protein